MHSYVAHDTQADLDPPRDTSGMGGEGRFALTVCAVFAVVVGTGLFNHEMWRDELQAWLLARAATSVPDLIHLTGVEGHPALWHLLLYPLTRVTGNPLTMQALHLVLATGAVYVMARFSPFPRWQRILLAGSYFLAFEFAVLSRGYVLGALALFSICAAFPLRRRSYLPLGFLLVLLANTSVYGLILAFAVGTCLVVDAWVEWRGWVQLRGRMPILAAVLVLAGALLSVSQILAEKTPASGDRTGYGNPVVPSVEWRAAESISVVARSWLPVPDIGSPELWNTSIFISGGRYALVSAAVLSIALLILVAGSLLERPVALVLLGTGTAAIVALAFMYHLGGMRHYGHIFRLLVASLWLGRTTRRIQIAARPGRVVGVLQGWAHVIFAVILVTQLGVAVLFFSLDARLPFSGSRATADYLAAMDAGKLLKVSTHSVGLPVAGYLQEPLYYMHSRQFGTYADWRLPWRAPEDALPALEEVVRAGGYQDVIIVTGRPVVEWLQSGAHQGWKFDEIMRIDNAMIRSESFIVYRARPDR